MQKVAAVDYLLTSLMKAQHTETTILLLLNLQPPAAILVGPTLAVGRVCSNDC